MTFNYTRTVKGTATGNQATVEQNQSEIYRGDLRCTVAGDDTTGTKYECTGEGEARYSSSISCTDAVGVTSHKEEAKPWQGVIHAALNFDLQDAKAKFWAFVAEAPRMQIHYLESAPNGKVEEKESEEQVISDIFVVDAKLNPDNISGAWDQSGEQIDELEFGRCETGVKALREKAELKVEISKR